MFQMKVCGNNGKCAPQGAGGKAKCECKNGFMGPSCGAKCPVSEGSICAGRGTCKYDKVGSTANCRCEEGYMGASCEFGCPGVHRNQQGCSGHGACSLFPDTTNPVGAKCTQCLEGFVGRDCGLQCPGFAASGKGCNGQGKCSVVGAKASCKCKTGWMGAGCTIKCPTDAIGSSCSNRGQCNLQGKLARCKCKDGFLGRGCQHACPRNSRDGKVCSSRGSCVMAVDGNSAVCECMAGAIGPACDAGCPVGKNKLPCSGHGACQLQEKNGGCKCETGWKNADCGHPICTVPTAIFNKVTGQCVCPAGNISCNPKALATKRGKEASIRKLRKQSKELNTMLEESTRSLEMRRSM